MELGGIEQEIKSLLDAKAFDEALKIAQESIQKFPRHEPFYRLLGTTMRGMGNGEAIIPILSKATLEIEDLEVWRCPDFHARQRRFIANGVPGIFLNTQFKSGSVFLKRALNRGLNMPWLFLFPEGVTGTAVPEWWDEFAKGGALSQQHEAFSDTLVDNLKKAPNAKLILHLRDPRQAALSAVHFYERVIREGPDYARRSLIWEMPEGYADWSFEQRADLFLGLAEDIDDSWLTWSRQNFEGQVLWLDRWLEAVEKNEIPIDFVVTDYADLVADQSAFFSSLLDQLDIPESMFEFSEVVHRPKKGTAHYRKGDPKEWREAFSARQKAKMQEMMTDRIAARYPD